MDFTEGKNVSDSAGLQDDSTFSKKLTPGISSLNTIQDELITSQDKFFSTEYEICDKTGKAVIVSNYMEGYVKRESVTPKDPSKRVYAKDDCEKLECVLKQLGFEPLTKDNKMIYKNLTQRELTELYQKAATAIDYRQNDNGYTCVLFIVMSYGLPGLIECHPENIDDKRPIYVEQKQLIEAFQPQNNSSLALKPKIFIFQTIPVPTSASDEGSSTSATLEKKHIIYRIPREADFLTYSCDSYCINDMHGVKPEQNQFVHAIVDVLGKEYRRKEKNETATELQKLLIMMNQVYDKATDRSDLAIPCVTSSLRKKMKLF